MVCLLLRPGQLTQLAREVNHAWGETVVVVLIPSNAINDAINDHLAREKSKESLEKCDQDINISRSEIFVV